MGLPTPSSCSNMHAVSTSSRVIGYIDSNTRCGLRELGTLLPGHEIMCLNMHAVDLDE